MKEEYNFETRNIVRRFLSNYDLTDIQKKWVIDSFLYHFGFPDYLDEGYMKEYPKWAYALSDYDNWYEKFPTDLTVCDGSHPKPVEEALAHADQLAELFMLCGIKPKTPQPMQLM